MKKPYIQLKSFFGLLLIFALLVSLLTACTGGSRDIHSGVENINLERLEITGTEFVQVAENDSLILKINPETTEISVTDKMSEETWYSNPQNTDEHPIEYGKNEELSSQITLRYSDSKNISNEINNYKYSISSGQFEFYKIENGIKVKYFFAPPMEKDYMPYACTGQDFEEKILKRFEDSKKDYIQVEDSYKKAVYDTASASLQETLDKNFTDPKKFEHIYILKDNVINIKRKRLNTLFEEYGFTLEEKLDFEKNVGLRDLTEVETFDVSLIYQLNDDILKVTVPTSEIETSKGVILTDLMILNYFGASSASYDGYAFVPDGSGAIIEFSDNRTITSSLNLKFYGDDKAISKYETSNMPYSNHLPVFGIVSSDKALFAVIEEGDAIAGVKGDFAVNQEQFNRIYPTFSVVDYEVIDLSSISGANAVKMFQRRPYSEDIVINYKFLEGKDATYSGMARFYRNYLKKKEVLVEKTQNENLPLLINILNAIDKEVPVIGYPVNKVIPVTDFPQTYSIIKEMYESGIKNIVVKLSGWSRGGIRNYIQKKVKPEKTLGGASGLIELFDECAKLGIEVYPDFNCSYLSTKRREVLDGFIPTFNALKNIRGTIGYSFRFNLSNNLRSTEYPREYIFSPKYKEKIVKKYNKSVAEFDGINGISLVNLGYDLTSDYNVRNQFNRQESLENDRKLFELLSENNKTMSPGTNAYALKYVDFIDKVPINSNLHDMYSASVPFYQMVVHGYKNYAMDRVNLQDIPKQQAILKAIETGSAISFQWMYSEDYVLRNSDFNSLYSINYINWIDEARLMYTEINDALKNVINEEIMEHEKLDKGVIRVTYSNKTLIYINYSNTTYSIGDYKLSPMSYKVVNDR